MAAVDDHAHVGVVSVARAQRRQQLGLHLAGDDAVDHAQVHREGGPRQAVCSFRGRSDRPRVPALRRRYPVVAMPAGARRARPRRRPTCGPSTAAAGPEAGQALGRGDGALLRPAAGAARPADLARRGRHAADLGAGLGREFGLRRLMIKDERLNPTGAGATATRRWRVVGAIAPRTPASPLPAQATTRCASRSRHTRRGRGCARSAWWTAARRDGSRVIDAIEGVGGRAVGVSGSDARWALLADAERMLSWKAVSNRTVPPIGGDPVADGGVSHHRVRDRRAVRLGGARPGRRADRAGRRHPGHLARFKDLADWGVVDSLPRMVAVETGGALASALAGGKDWVVPSPDANGAARSLSGVTGTVQGLNAVVESEGLVVRVTDAELEAARTRSARPRESGSTWPPPPASPRSRSLPPEATCLRGCRRSPSSPSTACWTSCRSRRRARRGRGAGRRPAPRAGGAG